MTFNDHPTADAYFESLTINMRACEIQSMTTSGDSSHTYNIYTPVEYVSYSAFTQTHVTGTERSASAVCGYTIDYTAMWRTYYNTVISLPSFIVWNHANLRFEI